MSLKNKKRILGLGSMLGSIFLGNFLLIKLDIESNYVFIPLKLSVIALFVWGFFTTLFNELEN